MPDPGLETLVAERAIRRLISGYCDAVARRDADALALVFAPDVEVRIMDLPVRVGLAAAIAGLRRSIEAYSFLHQRCDTGLIDVTGDRARARLGVLELNRAVGEDGLNLMTGVYEDEFIRRADGWRFHRRHFTMQLRLTLPPAAITAFPEFVPAFTVVP